MKEYIERETYRNRLADLESWCQDLRKPGLKQALEMFDEVPAADVTPVVHGRWVHHDDGVVTCSECGNAESSDSYYCRYCGAKMDGGVDDASL
jgi:hypothetical protein